MDLKRFEKAVNDGIDTRDEALTEVLKDILKEHHKLKAEAIPGFMHQLRDRLKQENSSEYWFSQFVIIPFVLLITILLSIGITHCGAMAVEYHVNDIRTAANTAEWISSETFYYLDQANHDQKGQCTMVMVKVKGFEKSQAATECFDDPLEAAKFINMLEQKEK